jgi:hypothetical protein
MLMQVRAFLLLLGVLALQIATSAQQPNDNFDNRIPVEPSIPFDASVNGATFEPLDPLPAYIFPIAGHSNGSVWWTWTPQATGFASIIDTKNDYLSWGGFDALAVFEGNDLAALSDPVWIYITPIFGIQINGPKAFLGFPTTAGLPLSIGMVGETTRDSSHNFLITFSETPIIVEAPASQTNVAGGAVAFRFTSPSYRFGHTQWQFNARDIPNATNAVLFLSDIRPANAGEYRVVVEATNSVGILKQTISPAATLTVVGDVTPPTVSLQRTASSPSDFLVTILGPTNQWYSVDRTSDFKTWIPMQTEYLANTVKNGQPTPIAPLANVEFLRAKHRGNLPEVCVQNLRQIHFAKELLRFAYHRLPGDSINRDDLKEFLGELPRCPQDGIYSYNPMDTAPACSWATQGHDAYAGVIGP